MRLGAQRTLIAILLGSTLATFALTGCSSSGGGSGAALFQGDSAAVKLVKDGSVKACPNATLGQMADAFMSNPRWRDFTSTTGGTVVELQGEISYQNLPATAVMQFTVTTSTGNFEIAYLGINDTSENKLVIAALLNKMCAAV